MGCAHHTDLAKTTRPTISVNGIAIAHAAISREAQNHRARTPLAPWYSAASALVVRELLLQEARRLGITAAPLTDAAGRRETGDEALIRALLGREVATPEPGESWCRRYFDHHRDKFRSPDLYEAAHILFAASRSDTEAFARKRREAIAALCILQNEPARFAELARAHSACPSAQQGGNLGQIAAGQTTPEFEAALARLEVGTITPAPVETRYGFHIIRLDRRIEGAQLPFEAVAQDIAHHLRETAMIHAQALYVRSLAAQARIEGVQLGPMDREASTVSQT